MTIAGHDLVLAVAARTLPIVALIPRNAQSEPVRSLAMNATTPRTAREVLDRYDEAFRLHDPALLEDLVADECVIEDTSPAPDGARHEGRRACLARWSELAG